MPNIPVNSPYMPNKKQFLQIVEEIYDSGHLTNNGPNVDALEQALAKELGVKNILLVANATLGLQLSLLSARWNDPTRQKKKVLTTPFSFAATSNVLTSMGLEPIFGSIDPKYYNLVPDFRSITEIQDEILAIMPVHTFGNFCDVKGFDELANELGCELIYDACHCFGSKLGDESILNYGNKSVISFHATKVFSTIEGGAIVCNDQDFEALKRFRNFGIINQNKILNMGINGKMSEVHAAFGLAGLPLIEENWKFRKKLYTTYMEELKNVANIEIMIQIGTDRKHSYPYFPIKILNGEQTARDLKVYLANNGVETRRYFYPSLADVHQSEYSVNEICDHKNVLCLPFHSKITIADVKFITSLIKRYLCL